MFIGPKALVLDFTDGDGKRYVFFKKNLDKHKVHHAELNDPEFIKKIKKIVCECEPEEIYRSYKEANSYCYYETIGHVNGQAWYTKVVVKKERGVYHISTAFKFYGQIREKKYGSCVGERP